MLEFVELYAKERDGKFKKREEVPRKALQEKHEKEVQEKDESTVARRELSLVEMEDFTREKFIVDTVKHFFLL